MNKTKISLLLSGMLLGTGANAQMTLNPVVIDSILPLVTRERVDPNIFFTLDDSGSMRNMMTYNPLADYPVPPAPSGGLMPAPWFPGASSAGRNLASFNRYYSTRILAQQSSLAVALEQANFNFEFGYQTINRGGTLIPVRSYQNNNAKSNFLTWLYGTRADGWTPARRPFDNVRTRIMAANNHPTNNVFLDGIDTNDDGIMDSSPREVACKQNYQILLTDGGWNQWYGGSVPANYDTSTINLGGIDENGGDVVTSFTGGAQPHERLIAGGRIDVSLSDIALFHWANDLNPNLPDIVQPYYGMRAGRTTPAGNVIAPYWLPDNDPANWQHLVTYTIGLGQGTELDQDDENSYFDGSSIWGTGTSNDLVHAAYAGRGFFSRADTPEDLSDTFNQIFLSIQNRSETQSAGGASASNSQLSSNSGAWLFNTELDFDTRTGDLNANQLYDGNIADLDACFGAGSDVTEHFVGELCSEDSKRWSAAENMPTFNTRRNKVFSIKRDRDTNGDYEKGEGIIFDEGNMNDEQRAEIELAQVGTNPVSSSLSTADIVNYLKGDSANEDDASVRSREAEFSGVVLGDIGRSSPVYVGQPEKYYWDNSNGTARDEVVYVGANDGMLHAFKTGDGNGKELFAYVPNSLYPDLSNLIKVGQGHRAFVDGQIVVQDLKPNNTLLVATLGVGGRGLFALNVATPENFQAKDVLWELDERDDPALGEIMGKPSIIQVEGTYNNKDNPWVVVVGTGYNNNIDADDGVMVIDAETGEIIEKLVLPNAEGVGEIKWIDHQKHKNMDAGYEYRYQMDRGYVSDLTGNLWVLDFSANKSDQTVLKSALVDTNDSPIPLFKATDKDDKPQIITAAPIISKHPTNRGYMVYFGTGEMFSANSLSEGANSPYGTNSMYGIWDDVSDNFGEEDYTHRNTKTLTRQNLRYLPWTQYEDKDFVSGTGAAFRGLDKDINEIRWANFGGNADSNDSVYPNKHFASGWVADTGPYQSSEATGRERIFQPAYISLSQKGEKGVSFIMSTITSSSNPCVSSGATAKSWVMTFRIDSIGGPSESFSYSHTDYNGDGKVDDKDKVIVPDPNNPGSTIQVTPLAAMPVADAGLNNGLLFSPQITGALNVNSTMGSCDGDSRTYTTITDNGKREQRHICLASKLSSWVEIE